MPILPFSSMGPPRQALLIFWMLPCRRLSFLFPFASTVVPIESSDGSWWPSEEWICARMEGRTHGVEESDYKHADTELQRLLEEHTLRAGRHCHSRTHMAVRRWRRRSWVLQRLPAQGLAKVAAQGPWRLPNAGSRGGHRR
ncbi:hypothetical protein PVAP13_6KG248912 [Panicum virgatum]|uniref:Uncharacterized protein n=1 Tax=Panicum virgatum TaxID=38727 RepID=A0A8T0RFH2_PANVG|nr:hypothetical protein PVAP13_6KG248912 [Panicum virgatum]